MLLTIDKRDFTLLLTLMAESDVIFVWRQPRHGKKINNMMEKLLQAADLMAAAIPRRNILFVIGKNPFCLRRQNKEWLWVTIDLQGLLPEEVNTLLGFDPHTL